MSPTSLSVDSFISRPGITLSQINDTLKAHLDPADTAEGGELDDWQTFKRIWRGRVTANDSSGRNMFQQYHIGLRKAILDGMTAPCSSSPGYQGAWESIGPENLPEQTIGKIDVVWSDGEDSNHILAGCQGGLFETTNGGGNWACITDNAPFAGGLMGITGICVNPLNKNTIYLGTGIPIKGGEGVGGASILKSFDGGVTWQQEIINTNSGYYDTIANVQRVYMTPDSMRLYAFRDGNVFTRQNVDTAMTWHKITPTGANTTWTNLQFVPGNRDRFFISSNRGVYGNKAGIWMAADSMGSSWTEITAPPFTATFISTAHADTDFSLVSISMPDADTLFFSILFTDPSTNIPNTSIYKYSLSADQFDLVNPNVPDITGNGVNKGELAVSPAGTTHNHGLRNVYFGWDVPYHSSDGGVNFHAIGQYYNDPTHGDVRSIYIQKAVDTIRGINDRVIIATDGGVSVKRAGTDDVIGGSATQDISGKGLACGDFWAFESGEGDGIGIGAMMHD